MHAVFSGSRVGLVAVAVAATMALTGCGEEKKADDAGTAKSDAISTTVDKALADKVPAEVKSDGTIKIGTDATYAPNEFLAEDGKTVQGVDVDLFDLVAKKLDLKTEWVPSKFPDIVPGVQSGKYEVGVSSFTINDERKKVANMVSYFSAGTQWATKKGNPAGVTPDGACGKKVAVQTGTVQETDDLPKRQQACKAAGKPEIQVDSYQSQADATSAVVTGKDDAMLADSPVAAYAVKQTEGQLETAGEIYDAAPYGYVLPQAQADLAQVIADALKALISEGVYQKTLEKWGVADGAISSPAVNP